MIVSTTSTLQNKRILPYRGLVSGKAVMGANAAVGMGLDFEAVSDKSSMFIVTASGTAVVLE